MGVNKRQNIAATTDTQYCHTARSELGVCMGTDPNYPGSYLFALENGRVVERNVISNVQVIPHGWQRHPVILSTPIGVELVTVKDRAIRRIIIQPGKLTTMVEEHLPADTTPDPPNDPVRIPPVICPLYHQCRSVLRKPQAQRHHLRPIRRELSP